MAEWSAPAVRADACGRMRAKIWDPAALNGTETSVHQGECHELRHEIRAEREGFEPSDPVSQVNSLAVSPIRPLSHLSLPTTLVDMQPFRCPVALSRITRSIGV